MKFKLPVKSQKVYLNILISMTLSIVITMLVLSMVLYMNFESIALRQVYGDSMNSLMQTSRDVSIMTDTAVTLSNQIFCDLSVAKLLFYENPETYDMRSAMDQLTNYRLTIPFIDSVYVYNGKTEAIYINAISYKDTMREAIQHKKYFDDKQAAELLNDFNRYKPSMPIPRKFSLKPEEGMEKFYYTFIQYDAFTAQTLDSAVIVNISEDWISKVIRDDSISRHSETFIIDRNGMLVSNRKAHSMMTDISHENYIRRIIGSPASPGYFIDHANDEKSLITYTAPDKQGWVYIRIIPWSVLFSRIESMKTTTVLIGMGILIAGLFISMLVSKKIYIPINSIMLNLKRLEDEKRSDIEIIRQGMLKDMILGRETVNKKLLQEKLARVNMAVKPEGTFRMLLFKIDNYDGFCRKYDSEDRNLFRFGIMNIAEEILSKSYKADAVDMGEGNILMLCGIAAPSGESGEASFEELLKNVQEAVAKYIKVSLSITVSTDEEGIESINYLYRQVAEASLHRLLYGHGSILWAGEIVKLKIKEYAYPFHKEKQMVDALMAQRIEEAKALYSEIIEGTREFPFSAINLAISRLVFTVNDVVNTIRKNNSFFADFEMNLSFSLINNAETVEDINNQFFFLFEKLNRRLEERKNSKHDELIGRIHDIIDERYCDAALSIDSIAEILNISATYMCRLYKQHTLTTILDRIVHVRMERARALLLETQLPVSDIANETGFTNSSYFYKAFKKYNGTTPNDFRKNLQ